MGIFKIAAWPIRRKLLALLLAFFLTASAIIVATGLEHRKHHLIEAKNNALLLVQGIAYQQEQIAAGTRQMLSTLAHFSDVKMLHKAACAILFREIKNRDPMYSILGLVLPDGSLVASSTPCESALDLSENKMIKNVAASLDFSVGEYTLGKATGIETIY
jgi:hypothetical protein